MRLRHDPTRPAEKRRHGFTVCELLVALACVGTLLALLLPAVIYARESARRITCCSRLRELGIAVHAYHERQRRFPAAWRNQKSAPGFLRGWATDLLPELGEAPVAETLRNSPNATRELSAVSLAILLCPSDITEPTFELHAYKEHASIAVAQTTAADLPHSGGLPMVLPTANYVGVFGTTEADGQDSHAGESAPGPSDGIIVHDRRVRIADLERGASSTLLIGERTMAVVPSTWLGVDVAGEDAQCRLVGSAMTRPNCEECDECEFSSRHSGGANFLWADGHVELITRDVETVLYRQYAQRFIR